MVLLSLSPSRSSTPFKSESLQKSTLTVYHSRCILCRAPWSMVPRKWYISTKIFGAQNIRRGHCENHCECGTQKKVRHRRGVFCAFSNSIRRSWRSLGAFYSFVYCWVRWWRRTIQRVWIPFLWEIHLTPYSPRRIPILRGSSCKRSCSRNT